MLEPGKSKKNGRNTGTHGGGSKAEVIQTVALRYAPMKAPFDA